jgi:hypothetical protein
MEMLEAGQVVARDDEVHALLVLHLEVAHRPAVLGDDLEAQLPRLARREVRRRERECQAICAGGKATHRIGLGRLVVCRHLGVVAAVVVECLSHEHGCAE